MSTDARPARERTRTCERCGASILHSARGRPKRYCGVACRKLAYSERHRDHVQRLWRDAKRRSRARLRAAT